MKILSQLLEPLIVGRLIGKFFRCYRKGDFINAIKTIEKLLVLAPQSPSTYHLLGCCYMRLSDFGNAKKAFDSADMMYLEKHLDSGEEYDRFLQDYHALVEKCYR